MATDAEIAATGEFCARPDGTYVEFGNVTLSNGLKPASNELSWQLRSPVRGFPQCKLEE
jgi:hypothetical protein